jgi:hypothetical protein
MTADPDLVEAAWRMLAELGVSIADLRDDLRVRPAMPMVAEYLPRVVAAAGPGARRTYGTYWTRMAAVWATGASTRSWPPISRRCGMTQPVRRGRDATAAADATPANT